MILKKIKIMNYRQLESVELDMQESLTVLVGPNNSGKTTLISVLKGMFCDKKLGFSYSDIPISLSSMWLEKTVPVFQEIMLEYDKEKGVQKIIDEMTDNDKLSKDYTIDNFRAQIQVDYDPDSDNIQYFADYLMDLDDTKHSFYFIYTYEPSITAFEKGLNERYNRMAARVRDIENPGCIEKETKFYFLKQNDIYYTRSFSLQLLDVINQVLDDDTAYWEKGAMPYSCYDAEELKIIVEKLVACKRYATAVNIIGHSECEAVINAECIYKLMKLAGTEESIGVETLDDYAAQKIIGWFQQQEDIDLELRSDIEFIYLPMLDEYSEVRPRALNTRLSLEPEYFCSLIELFYKERNGEKREIELNKSLSDRLYEILFQFKVIPGIDWNGNFDAKRFDYWMKTVKTWSRDNDRYEVAMHTVGSGLSYAELDEDKLPQTAIIEELNRVENEELRRGYYLGIINQRGVHWIDPEGKPELELAEDYENRANTAESRGYSRYAGILRVIGDEFKREARRNALRARNENDDIE